ncbi:amidohydrolase [Cnuibacter sp. UC19_7]|uniref:amidohydrolase n=1 Tax=Cnuibacter sp. UC19_7 TaxID=3350166 RepID=UPI003672BDB7
MPLDRLVAARVVLTIDPDRPRAEAVGVDTATGTIVAVGSRDELTAAHPDADLVDLGDAALLPGFIDSHSHPIMSGMMCREPAHWIAPYVGYPTYADVTALFERLEAETPPGVGLLFNGLDRTLQSAPELTNLDLDTFFPDRPVFVLDNSGHEGYFSSALIRQLGWVGGMPPADPVGASFGRNPDGTSNGRCSELQAVMAVLMPMMATVLTDPLLSAAKWYRYMAENGITATTEHTFGLTLLPAITALASLPDSPLRLSLYHMSTEPDPTAPLDTTAPEAMVRKVGVKLWADGSPWVGTIATTFPYLDNETVRGAGITPGPGGEAMMNYTRAELDDLLDSLAGSGLQMAFHVNGDLGLDIVLDAYERALTRQGLLGADHGWRVEHVGGARAEQFGRAASLGVGVSMSPFQFVYWGDVLDGTLFASEIGSQWQRFADAVCSGATVSFHNDGSVSPPIPLLNIQAAVTRRTGSGAVRGPEQRIGIEGALKAETISAARHIGRGDDLGSIVPGKRADFVVLSADPTTVDPARLVDDVHVLGTWRDGRPLDLDAFLEQVSAVDPAQHADLPAHAAVHPHC